MALAAHAAETGLPDSCADVVTVGAGLPLDGSPDDAGEVARILRPGGVFAVYDYEWPPTVQPDIDAASDEVVRRLQPWGNANEDHLDVMRESSVFAYLGELWLHSVEAGDAARVVGLTLSLGLVARRLAEGTATEETIACKPCERQQSTCSGTGRSRSCSAIASESACADSLPLHSIGGGELGSPEPHRAKSRDSGEGVHGGTLVPPWGQPPM